MRTKIGPMIVSLAILAAVGGSAMAQEESRSRERSGETQARSAMEILLRLPEIAERARESGVPDEDVRVVLEETRRRSLPPEETAGVLSEATEAAKEHGPVDNFGAFVQARLAEGLRGRELAAAIRAEHAARGIGKGRRLGHERGGAERGDKGKGLENRGRSGDRPETDEGKGQGKGQGQNKGQGKGQGKGKGDGRNDRGGLR